MVKGQVAIEFASYSIMFLVAMGILISIVFLLGTSQAEAEKFDLLRAQLQEVSSAVILTRSLSGIEGEFNYSIKIPKTLAGFDYTLKFSRDSISIFLNNRKNDVDALRIPTTIFYAKGKAIKVGRDVIINSLDGENITFSSEGLGEIEVYFE